MTEFYLMVTPQNGEEQLKFEFQNIVSELRTLGLEILMLPASDAVKGNQYLCSRDWISFDDDRVVVVYPMALLDRQRERNDLVFELLEENNFDVTNVIDFTEAEIEGVFFHGLSSVVLDKINRVAYCSASQLSDPDLFIEFCEELEYTPILFNEDAFLNNERMKTSNIIKICEDFVLLCSSGILNKKERKLVLTYLKNSGREIIYVEKHQVENYVNDTVQCRDKKGNSLVLMSKTAFNSFRKEQLDRISSLGRIRVFDCEKIEGFGNHSLGAMMNEIIK